MKLRSFLALFSAVIFFTGLTCVQAADAAGAKERMRGRVASIDQLKLAEVIGENNRGYLELRKAGDAAGSAAVSAENQDRAVVFADTAARTGSSSDAVGRAFAKQVAAASARGVWVQGENGTWAKK